MCFPLVRQNKTVIKTNILPSEYNYIYTCAVSFGNFVDISNNNNNDTYIFRFLFGGFLVFKVKDPGCSIL